MPLSIKTIMRSRPFLAVSLLAAWFCFFIVLRDSENPVDLNSIPAETASRSVNSNDSESPDTHSEAEDILDRLYEFNVPNLNLARLAIILEAEGVVFEYPSDLNSLNFEAIDLGGKSLSEILVELLEPHKHGFFRQGRRIRVIDIQSDQGGAAAPSLEPVKSRFKEMRATIEASVGEPIDLWVENDPLVRLRIVVQPLYGEGTEGWIGMGIEGRRETENWFQYQDMTRIGDKTMFHTSGRELIWCLLKPISLDDSKITLEVQFHHESTPPLS